MKQFFTSVVLLLFAHIALAQAPQAINYQGVARNSSGTPYASQQITVRLSILSGTPQGASAYSETRMVSTNAFGLFNVLLGSAGASNVSGNFTDIDWKASPKFLQTEISISGQPFVAVGTTQMMSVPYALHSSEAKDLVLPFSRTVAVNNADVFHLRNTGISAYNTITAESVKGVAIVAASDSNVALRAYTSGKNQHAIMGMSFADSSVGVMGSVHFSKKGGVAVMGDGKLDHVGVKGISNNKAAVQGFSVNNYGLYGDSKNFIGVHGGSVDMAGVNGQSINGVGVTGLSEQGAGGVFGVAGQYSNGVQFGVMGEAFGSSTAVVAKSNSPDAKALLVDGKLKIINNGGALAAGKVLTSDASGNASWQYPETIAFRASGLRNDLAQSVPSGNFKKVLFYQTARYNIGNAYDAENALFFVPVAGIYALSTTLSWEYSAGYTEIYLKMLRGATISTIAESFSDGPQARSMALSTEIALQPNDAIWVEIRHVDSDNTAHSLKPLGYANWFTGHLISRL